MKIIQTTTSDGKCSIEIVDITDKEMERIYGMLIEELGIVH